MSGISIFGTGIFIGLGILLAIGPQILFILRQGLRREHVGLVCGTCMISELILTGVGVTLSTQANAMATWVDPVMRLGGAAFLVAFGLRAAMPVIIATVVPVPVLAGHGKASCEMPSDTTIAPIGRGAVFMTCMAFTWLNPHVYLETIVLLGSLSTNYTMPYVFGLGAVVGAAIFYYSVGFGARLLAPWFDAPLAWQRLDLTMGLLMIGLAVTLAMPVLGAMNILL